jgi:hypothetical protein
MRARVAEYSWDAATETIRNALDGVLAKPRVCQARTDAEPRVRSLALEDPQAQRRVALAG